MGNPRFGPDAPRLRCPKCGVKGLRVLYGLLNDTGFEATLAGQAVMGGRVGPGDRVPRWRCPNGHHWPADDSGQWRWVLEMPWDVWPACSSCDHLLTYLIHPDNPNRDLYAMDIYDGCAAISIDAPNPEGEHPYLICEHCGSPSTPPIPLGSGVFEAADGEA